MHRTIREAALFSRLFFVCVCCVGCAAPEMSVTSVEARQATDVRDYPFVNELTRVERSPVEEIHLPPVWRPRAHPPGTLLIGADRRLWMVVNWLERQLIPDRHMVREAGIDPSSAIPMSGEEERCLLPITDPEWTLPAEREWTPMLDLDQSEWLINRGLGMRRRAPREVLRSWGFLPWIDDFDMSVEEWLHMREVDPLRFRDGYMVQTESRLYYFVNDVVWEFESEDLAREAGYAVDRAASVRSDRLFELTTHWGTLTREMFSICPAETPLAEGGDRDGDGVPDYRDCDPIDDLIGEGLSELCDGNDNDCNGITDDPFPVGSSCTSYVPGCHAVGSVRCLPDGSGAYCDADDRCDG